MAVSILFTWCLSCLHGVCLYADIGLDELGILDQVFEDLASRSPASTSQASMHDKNIEKIDKITFLKFLKLPGIIGELLFNVFDKDNTQDLDYNQFVK